MRNPPLTLRTMRRISKPSPVFAGPLAKQPAAAPPPAQTDTLRGTETILLTEDEAVLRRTGQRILERFGYRVLLACDGIEALKIIDSHDGPINLIISDVTMPRLDGLCLYRELLNRGSKIPFIFATGLSLKEVEQECGEQYTGRFMQKPWLVEDVARTVREVLDTTKAS